MSGDPIPPFEVGERIVPLSLAGWNYVGLTGVPDQPNASRRYVKGMWVLELKALTNRKRAARVLSIRTETDDKQWWAKKAKR
ncbi:MAG: hypothetical protein GKR90_26070 [Pseudomonadales bacterium]|nr:hypothetical protein [Pseudomonadales bacterium]